MATVKINDVFVRELWTSEFIENNEEILNIVNSGLFRGDARIADKVASGDVGQIIEVPYIKENAYEEPSIMDDSDDEIVAGKISKDRYFAMIGFYAQAWAEKDIVTQLGSGTDPLAALQSLVGRYWATDLQKRAFSIMSGIAADNIANNSSDLVLTIGTDETGDASASEIFNAGAAIDVTGIAGDNLDNFDFVIMHSKVYNDVLKANLIETIQPSKGKPVRLYQGKRVIVNNTVPVTQGTNRKIYTTIFAKNGSLVYENKALVGSMPAAELDRNKKIGNGAGETSLIVRRGTLIHPNGWTIKSDQISGQSPTLAEFQAAGTWTRKINAERSNMVFLQSN